MYGGQQTNIAGGFGMLNVTKNAQRAAGVFWPVLYVMATVSGVEEGAPMHDLNLILNPPAKPY